MRYGISILAFVLGGFYCVELAREYYWLLQSFAAIGILAIFGTGAWLTATRWDQSNKDEQRKELERLRSGEPPPRRGFFD